MPSFKVLLLDGIDPAGVEAIEQAGSIAATVHNKIAREKLLEIVPEYDGIIVRSATAIDRELMQKATRLKVVGGPRGRRQRRYRDGHGTRRSGDELSRRFHDHNRRTCHCHVVRSRPKHPSGVSHIESGKWEKSKFKGVEITGKTLGVVGLGRIGSEVARNARPWE